MSLHPLRAEVIGQELALVWSDGKESYMSATARRALNFAASVLSAGTRLSRPGTTATTRASTLSANSAPSTKMPPREFIKPRDKREELKTYRELTLRRDLKSIRQRRRVEAKGDKRVLGDGSDTQPYLIVETRRYRQVRLEVQRRLLVQARQAGLDLSVDLLLRQLKPRIEALTYAQLAEEGGHDALRHVPVAALGRALTAGEQARFAASRAASEGPARKANQACTALNHVLGSIEQRQTHNPARYQTLWAELVGTDAAQQSQLDHIEPNTQTAYFRCYNSVLSTDLQRRPGLAQKLARALGLPIRQLRAKF
jgi:hypothetical protein